MCVCIFQVSTLKMTSFICFLKHPFVVSLSVLLSICFWGYAGIWIITCTLVLLPLSAFIFTFLSQQKNAESDLDNKSIDKDGNVSNGLEKKLMSESELHEDDHSDVSENEGREKGNHLYQDVGEVSYSESESNDISFSSEDLSDGSISDEESLIEIEIPSGNYLASPRQTQKDREEEDKEFISKLCNFHQFKEPMFDFFDVKTKGMFKQQHIMDLLTELNDMNMEEDNLIEIDIAMGSIKCPRYEIEA